MHRLRIHLRLPISVTPIQVLSVNKFNLLQNLHLYTEKSIGATSTRPFREVGGKFPLQLS